MQHRATALHVASQHAGMECIEPLWFFGANVNAQSAVSRDADVFYIPYYS